MLSNERFKRRNGRRFSWLVNVRRPPAWLPSTQLTLTTEYEQALPRRCSIIRLRIKTWDRPLDVALNRLRHRLQDDPKRLRYFKTMWGTGHRVLRTLERVPAERSGG